MGTYVGGMVANVDLFERAGVKLPGKDWTFADLRDIARRLKTGRTWGFERQTGAWDQGWTSQFAERRRRVVRPQDAEDDPRTSGRTAASRRRCTTTGGGWSGATALAPNPDEVAGGARATPAWPAARSSPPA